MKKLAVFDLETDPFKFGRKPEPFAAGFFDGKLYKDFWGDNCVDLFVDYINELDDAHLIYAHNGGKFDFMYLLEKGYIQNPIKIINGRIVSAMLGKHELRDSYAILPVPLAAYQKDDIDYNLFERESREEHRNDILHYLCSDCDYLYTFVFEFIEKFGLHMTIGSCAIKTLKKYHPFEHQKQSHDEKFRPFYFGGRVECFKYNKVVGDFKVYDVNSMYPFVMSKYDHPTGTAYENISVDKLDIKGVLGFNRPYFIELECDNKGAFPFREKTGLNFNIERGVFQVTGWEYQVALKYNLIGDVKIINIHAPQNTINFSHFVSEFVAEKIKYQELGDKAHTLFVKLILNSGYGKFGQNPDNFYDYFLAHESDGHLQDPWEIYQYLDGFVLWRKESPKPIYYDVATAASITGAARAVLLEAIQLSDTVLYCDTDSIICKDINVEKHPTKLGAWDLEASGDVVYLAGKKLYSMFDGAACVKHACKGVRLSGEDIAAVAMGEVKTWKSTAPNFKLSGAVKFIERTVKAKIT